MTYRENKCIIKDNVEIRAMLNNKFADKGLFKRAAAEYLNSAELKERQATGRGGSVAKRNRSNSLIFSGKAKISDFIDGKV